MSKEELYIMKKNILRLSAVISSIALMFSLCACSGSEKPGDVQIDVSIAEEQTPVEEEPVDTIEDTEEPEEEIEEEKIVLSVPEKYLTPLGLDSRFNDWINTERNVDDFIEIYGTPDNGEDGVYYYNNYSVFYDTESRCVSKLGLSPKVFESLNGDNKNKTPDIYNPFDLPSNLTTLKPLTDIGYFEVQNTNYCNEKNVDCIVRATMDLKIKSSQEEFNKKYKTIFDLENDLGEAYISENYIDKTTYTTCIDFTNNCFYVMWHDTHYSDSDPNKRKGSIPKMIATVSMEDSSIIDLSRVFELKGRNAQDDSLKCSTADEYGISY